MDAAVSRSCEVRPRGSVAALNRTSHALWHTHRLIDSMKHIKVTASLGYELTDATPFILQIAAARNSHQSVQQENLTIEPAVPWREGATVNGNRCYRFTAQPGALNIFYEARVQLHVDVASPSYLHERANAELPDEVLEFLNPSRYCESDRLLDFATTQFGASSPGYSRVEAVVSWVNKHLSYTPGATHVSTTACDVMQQKAGVCRDYAHLTIALCRALGIPARYVAGYAVDLEPPDFHGFCEVYLGSSWYLFDATGLAPVNSLVRITTGRDAADTSFASFVGRANFQPPEVMAIMESNDKAPDSGPVSTA